MGPERISLGFFITYRHLEMEDAEMQETVGWREKKGTGENMNPHRISHYSKNKRGKI